LLFDRPATDLYRFRLCPIRFAPIFAGLSQIPPGAAVSADLGFTLIAVKSQRIVIITIRWRIPHGPHFDSSICQKGIRWFTPPVRPKPSGCGFLAVGNTRYFASALAPYYNQMWNFGYDFARS
jgi:hypothetical protein